MILNCVDSKGANSDNKPMKTLDQLKTGTFARVLGFTASREGYRQKLLAMGLTPGCEINIVRVAPLGDPIQINLRGFQLSLRKTEAKMIEVEQIKK